MSERVHKIISGTRFNIALGDICRIEGKLLTGD
jgi:hypothetical protein